MTVVAGKLGLFGVGFVSINVEERNGCVAALIERRVGLTGGGGGVDSSWMHGACGWFSSSQFRWNWVPFFVTNVTPFQSDHEIACNRAITWCRRTQLLKFSSSEVIGVSSGFAFSCYRFRFKLVF